jgi:hypothetical protein
MSRPKKAQTSAEIDAEIRRLQDEKQRAIVAEYQRRGELVRAYLAGRDGERIRDALREVVSHRDARRFGLGSVGPDGAGRTR